MTKSPHMWTTPQVAEFLQVSERTVERMREANDGPPYFTIRGRVRYVPRQVHDWVVTTQASKS